MRNLGTALIIVGLLAACRGDSERAHTAADTVASPSDRTSSTGTSSTAPIPATGTEVVNGTSGATTSTITTPTTTTASISTPTETTSTVVTRTTRKKSH